MTPFERPAALIGLLLIAAPVIIHLLGRQRARVQRFPTLRFLSPSRLMPTRRTRLNDLWLLAIRSTIVACAALALARPVFNASGGGTMGSSGPGAGVARAIVLDTSASMRRRAPGGTPALAVARSTANQMAADAAISKVTETSMPARAIAGASEWLRSQSGKRELVVVSDFQRGTLDSTDLSSAPVDVGITLARIDVADAGTTVQGRIGGRDTRITPGLTTTDVEWSAARAPRTAALPTIFVSDAERPGAEAALAAATAEGAEFLADAERPVAFIYTGYAGRPALVRNATAVHAKWMGDAIVRLRAETTLRAIAASAVPIVDTALTDPRFTVLFRDGAGRPIGLASSGDLGGRPHLELWVLTDAGSLMSAALLNGMPSALSSADSKELDPRRVPPDELRRWERPAGAPAPRIDSARSDGRWFWLLALLLLAVETAMRRAKLARSTTDTVRKANELPDSSGRAA